jgi:hypothetical protein
MTSQKRLVWLPRRYCGRLRGLVESFRDGAERIREVAVQLGHRTNPLARALPTGRTSMIALVISDGTNPFYNEIIGGAQSAAAAADADYTMLLADAQESGTIERGLSNGPCRRSRGQCSPRLGCPTRPFGWRQSNGRWSC